MMKFTLTLCCRTECTKQTVVVHWFVQGHWNKSTWSCVQYYSNRSVCTACFERNTLSQEACPTCRQLNILTCWHIDMQDHRLKVRQRTPQKCKNQLYAYMCSYLKVLEWHTTILSCWKCVLGDFITQWSKRPNRFSEKISLNQMNLFTEMNRAFNHY